MLSSFKDTVSNMSMIHKLYHHATSALLMVGAIPAIAIFNVVDKETWKRGFLSVTIGIVACVFTLPLLPILALGIACSMIEDRFLP